VVYALDLLCFIIINTIAVVLVPFTLWTVLEGKKAGRKIKGKRK